MCNTEEGNAFEMSEYATCDVMASARLSLYFGKRSALLSWFTEFAQCIVLSVELFQLVQPVNGFLKSVPICFIIWLSLSVAFTLHLSSIRVSVLPPLVTDDENPSVLVRVTFAATLSRVMPTGDADMKFFGDRGV